MLVLTRKAGEALVIGDGITVTVLMTKGQKVRLGIEAPEGVSIMRAELLLKTLDGIEVANELNGNARPCSLARKSR